MHLLKMQIFHYQFQSTHPSWGATWKFILRSAFFNISIHAPIVGCDIIPLQENAMSSHFNPRTHRGVRHDVWSVYRWLHEFQSTHPSWGATFPTKTDSFLLLYFNPRTHRGVRPANLAYIAVILDFNPRTHRGVRHFNNYNQNGFNQFQSTHPSWGATVS